MAHALRIGLISDLHAQYSALHEALDRLDAAAVDRIVCLGDVVEKGPDGDAVVQTLQSLCIPTVKGNHDHNAVRHAALVGRRACGLSPSTLAWLEALPDIREYLWAGKYVLLAHGSPVNRGIGVHPGDVPKVVRRGLRRTDADVVALGHTHRPMRMRFGDTWIVNPGSVAHGRCDLGPTCAVLSLPAMTLEVCVLRTGRWQRLLSDRRTNP